MADKNNVYRLKTIAAGVSETSKIRIDDVFKKFQLDNRLTDFTFPNVLTSHERAYVHDQAGRCGLKSQSSGSGENRRVNISKSKALNDKVVKSLELSPRSILEAQNINMNYPRAKSSKPDTNVANGRVNSSGNTHTLRVSSGPGAKIPKPRFTNRYDYSRKRLPIWKYREKILETIEDHKVSFIKGATGCGKTTQVPQFILDDATEKEIPVRILCTVPRRIAAISISDRVATERGEKVGYTVGYQIRLESCFSPSETLLTYCTSGLLLRSFIAYDYSILQNTTHIIIDEVHERDRQTDFLLACLRDVAVHFPDLRVILMGADMDSQLMTTYFGGVELCPTIPVEGKLFPVEIMFLENILDMLVYQNHAMSKKSVPARSSRNVMQGLVNAFRNQTINSNNNERAENVGQGNITIISDEEKRKNAAMYNVDAMIQEVWINGDESAMINIIELVQNNLIPIDYSHSITSVTILMACAVRGWTNHAATLLSLGADANLRFWLPNHGKFYTAKDWANDNGCVDVVQLLSEYEYTNVLLPMHESSRLDESTQERVNRYLASVDDDRVDLLLILQLINKIHINSDLKHAILVFLPGYEEITTLKQMIFTDPDMQNHADSLVVFLLHSNIQTGDQKAVFERTPPGTRKIVLSTNIAETSLTIEDIVYVIDSGKVKEKTFDSMTGVTQLKSTWISKASANQRQGRAGRCQRGICYRLYTSARYESMAAFPTPEIVRTSLQELCLYTRCFIRNELKICDFFSRLPEPPAPIAVKKAVDQLTALGALDADEDLTKLGLYLLDFPIEPSLGKALIYAVVLKCLDPVLTIVSIISYREPFQLPANPAEKQEALAAKLKFSSDAMSDHMACLKAFQDWEKSKLFRENIQRRFCRDHYLSAASFEMVYGIRSQLLGQLRASGFVNATVSGDLKELNFNSDNWALVKGVLTAALYPNVCSIDRIKKCLFNEYESKVAFHPAATPVMKRKNGILGLPTDWVIYDEICQQGNSRMIRGTTCVSDLAMALFAGNFNDTLVPYEDGVISTDIDENNGENQACVEPLLRFDINEWISFKSSKLTIEFVIHLRCRLHDILLRRLKAPHSVNSSMDNSIINTFAAILAYEDEACGLKNVEGIGQWPKLVSGNMMAVPRTGYNRSHIESEYS